MKAGFLQEAHGRITLKVLPGSHHCGRDDNALTCRWFVSATFTDAALDPAGFLFDNLAFAAYWQSLAQECEQAPLAVSCELLAKRAADDLLGSLGDRRAAVVSFRVEVKPFASVGVAYRESGATVDSLAGPGLDIDLERWEDDGGAIPLTHEPVAHWDADGRFYS